MSGPIRLFVGSYPEFYDRLLVPVLFAPYARILAERVRGMTVGNVLEIAAGTGRRSRGNRPHRTARCRVRHSLSDRTNAPTERMRLSLYPNPAPA